MAGKLVRAYAWNNGEVAYLAWEADRPIEGCVGFLVTRIHETGPEQGTRRILPTWIAFRDQSNPDWLEQDSSVWPIQQYQWRDLTLRRSRNTTDVRPIDFKVRYEIAPVGLNGKETNRVPVSDTAPYLDANGKPRYEGPQHPLFFIGEPVSTDVIDVTHDFAEKGAIKATFTNGILSTQNLRRQLESLQNKKNPSLKPGPATSLPKGILSTLKSHIARKGDEIRMFLTADVLAFLTQLIDRAEKSKTGELYLALYELHDPELISRLDALVKAGKGHVILSTASKTDLTVKNDPPPRKPVVWDVENYPARQLLHASGGSRIEDRLFNNDDHIGHNKFAVYVEKGVACAVMTGSTNWTETGLCTQSNNVVVIENEDLAKRYLGYWSDLLADKQPAGVPLTVTRGKKSATGYEPNKAVQGARLRESNAKPTSTIKLQDGATIETFFSPNTHDPVKNRTSPTPVDLARVYSLMEHAQDAILFLTFFPGVRGEQNIIGTAADLAARRPDLLVQGAISNAQALPPTLKPGAPTTYKAKDGTIEKLPQPSIWWPDGDASRIVMVRASAIAVQHGNMRPEILSAGHAIIHDKIIVIDPLDPEKCAVITGSHNLGYKASYQNDENMLLIRGNRALATAYAVHVLDTYDHYVMRAKLEDERRESLIKTGEEPVSETGGFLRTTGDWQMRWFEKKPTPSSRDYFLKRGG